MTGRLLTGREVADRLGLSTKTVLRWAQTGELPAIRLSNRAIRFREDELDEWLRARATPYRAAPTVGGAARTGRLHSLVPTVVDTEEQPSWPEH